MAGSEVQIPPQVTPVEERVEAITTSLSTALTKMAAARGNSDVAEKTLEGLKRKVAEAEAARDEHVNQKAMTVAEIVAVCDAAITTIRDIQQEFISEVNGPERKDAPQTPPPPMQVPTVLGHQAEPPQDTTPPPTRVPRTAQAASA